jgi:O-antigen ligase
VVYTGLLIELVLVYIRPADWVQAILNWPLEFVLLGVIIPAGIVRRFTKSPRDRGSVPIQVPLAALYVVAIFLSNAVHLNFSSAMEFSLSFGKKALLFFIFWLAIDSVPKLRRVVVLLVALTAILGLQGIYQAQHAVGWAGQPLGWEGRIQWVGLWDGPDVLSLLFVTAMPYVFEMIFGPWGVFSKIFALSAGVLMTIGLFLAASRGGFLALGVACLVYFRKRLGKFGLVLGALAVLAILVLGPSRLTHGNAADEHSTALRIDVWAEGLEMLKYNPLLGIGKGRFQNYTQRLIAHNTFVQNMGETGLVGLFIWVALVYFSLQNLGIVLKHEHELSVPLVSVSRALLVSFIAYMAASMFISTDFEPFYILVGLSAAVPTIARRESGRDLQSDFSLPAFRNIVFIEVAGILLFHFACLAYSGV